MLPVILVLLGAAFLWQRRRLVALWQRHMDREIGRKTAVMHPTTAPSSVLESAQDEIGQEATKLSTTQKLSPLMAATPLLATFVMTQASDIGLRQIVMRQPKLTLGRTRDAGVDEVLPSPKISQIHCTIEYDHHEASFYIRDERSTNGTFVDGHRLLPRQRERLTEGALIRLGQVIEMRFQPNVALLRGQTSRPADAPRRPLTSRAALMEGVLPHEPPPLPQKPTPKTGRLIPPQTAPSTQEGPWPLMGETDETPRDTRLAPPQDDGPRSRSSRSSAHRDNERR